MLKVAYGQISYGSSTAGRDEAAVRREEQGEGRGRRAGGRTRGEVGEEELYISHSNETRLITGV